MRDPNQLIKHLIQAQSLGIRVPSSNFVEEIALNAVGIYFRFASHYANCILPGEFLCEWLRGEKLVTLCLNPLDSVGRSINKKVESVPPMGVRGSGENFLSRTKASLHL